MSTSCTISFYNDRPNGNNRPIAKIYRHSDGYPDTEHGVLASLSQFFHDVIAQTEDTRFDDPSYLAAKFVVWQADQYARKGGPLDFLGVGVVSGDFLQGNYIYAVVCNKREEVPVVLHKAYGEDCWNDGVSP